MPWGAFWGPWGGLVVPFGVPGAAFSHPCVFDALWVTVACRGFHFDVLGVNSVAFGFNVCALGFNFGALGFTFQSQWVHHAKTKEHIRFLEGFTRSKEPFPNALGYCGDTLGTLGAPWAAPGGRTLTRVHKI